ncbi:Alpha/Beta hydrolase protein [Clohesyomyces aquaticus]|uniref:1-alkyl-2-acetylglycerophosphocholine esterase n=1 Tax=Clohesyomyces aquaticus TaxID=1231657 RepID=A0A1Y1YPB6_9PLEO|nr:Alpha/Beta hydrolase protein [Clohesyomyces aquaticus]
MQSTFFIFLFLLVNTTTGYRILAPTGKYNVTLTTGTLVDYTRNDSSAGKPTPRALMLSVFQPVTCASTVPVPYMPNQTAEYQGPFLQQAFNISADLTPLFLEARLAVCPDDLRDCSSQEGWPILLFSPGYGIPRLYYSDLASAIASEGFTVITIDHPSDANIITYPYGHAIYGTGPASPTPDEYTRYVYRVADAFFIIDQLGNATAIASLLPHRGPRRFKTDRVAMLGHSLGGAAAVVAAGQDPRIRGLSQPVLYVSEANATDPTWVAAWPQLKGPKLWIEVAKTTHESFSDASTLVQAAGMDTVVLAGLLGTIAPDEMGRILAAYTAAWMSVVFEGKVGELLLEGKEPERFPEAEIVTNSNF